MTSPAPPLDRPALRQRLIAARMAMGEAEHAEKSARVLAALAMRFPPVRAPLVGGYWPIRGEVDPRPYLEAVLSAGGAVSLPAVIGPGMPLEYRRWIPATPMEAGPFGIPHPTGGPAVTPALLLVPLVGFDAAGHRLGYGGGFYDRTLDATAAKPVTVGLGFELGRLPSIAPQAHDHPMDFAITEAGVVHGG